MEIIRPNKRRRTRSTDDSSRIIAHNVSGNKVQCGFPFCNGACQYSSLHSHSDSYWADLVHHVEESTRTFVDNVRKFDEITELRPVMPPQDGKSVICLFELADSRCTLHSWLPAVIGNLGHVIVYRFSSLSELNDQIKVFGAKIGQARVLVFLSSHSSPQGQVFATTPFIISSKYGFEEFHSLYGFINDCHVNIRNLIGIHSSCCFGLRWNDKEHHDWPVPASLMRNLGDFLFAVSGSTNEVYYTGSQAADAYFALSFIENDQWTPKIALNRAKYLFPDLCDEMGLVLLHDSMQTSQNHEEGVHSFEHVAQPHKLCIVQENDGWTSVANSLIANLMSRADIRVEIVDSITESTLVFCLGQCRPITCGYGVVECVVDTGTKHDIPACRIDWNAPLSNTMTLMLYLSHLAIGEGWTLKEVFDECEYVMPGLSMTCHLSFNGLSHVPFKQKLWAPTSIDEHMLAFSYPLSSGRVIHYDIMLIPLMFAPHKITGHVDMDVESKTGTSSMLLLDIYQLDILNVFDEHGVPLLYYVYDHVLVIQFASKVSIDFVSENVDNGSVVWCKSGGSMAVFTGGSKWNNRTLLPHQDHPSACATYRVRVRVPDEYRVITSADECRPCVPICAQLVQHEFLNSDAVPLVTFSIVVGKWDKFDIPGLCGSLFVPHNEKGDWSCLKSTWKHIFDTATNMLGPYPFPRCDILIAPRHAFSSLGFASPNITIISPTVVFPIMPRRLAHELAHAWFGIKVGLADQSEAWLSEGPATYFEDLFVSSNQYHHEIVALLRMRTLKWDLDQLPPAKHLMKCSDDDGTIQLDTAHQIPYLKGFFLIKYLEHHIGQDSMVSFMKSLLGEKLLMGRDVIANFVQQHSDTEVSVDDIEKKWFFSSGIPTDALIVRNNPMCDAVEQVCHGQNQPRNLTFKDWTQEQHCLLLDKFILDGSLAERGMKIVNMLKYGDRSVWNADVCFRCHEFTLKHSSKVMRSISLFILDDTAYGAAYLLAELVIKGCKEKTKRILKAMKANPMEYAPSMVMMLTDLSK